MRLTCTKSALRTFGLLGRTFGPKSDVRSLTFIPKMRLKYTKSVQHTFGIYTVHFWYPADKRKRLLKSPRLPQNEETRFFHDCPLQKPPLFHPSSIEDPKESPSKIEVRIETRRSKATIGARSSHCLFIKMAVSSFSDLSSSRIMSS